MSKQLELSVLERELQQTPPNPVTLRQAEKSLRRILPGRIQITVDELRKQIYLLARQLSGSAVDQADLNKAIEILTSQLREGNATADEVDETTIRNAFRTIASNHVDIAQVALLRNQLSLPNYLSRVRSDFLIHESYRSFTIPIEFRKCTDNTSIAGIGEFKVDLSLEIPPSSSESFLRICADGKGMIDVTAQRSKATVCATIKPRINGSQGVHLRVKDISADQPCLKAALNTNLTGGNIDGILGRSRLVQNVVQRAVQKKLTDNDPALAKQIEMTVASRVEEEAYQLAYRINGLIRHGVWDRSTSRPKSKFRTI